MHFVPRTHLQGDAASERASERERERESTVSTKETSTTLKKQKQANKPKQKGQSEMNNASVTETPYSTEPRQLEETSAEEY